MNEQQNLILSGMEGFYYFWTQMAMQFFFWKTLQEKRPRTERHHRLTQAIEPTEWLIASVGWTSRG